MASLHTAVLFWCGAFFGGYELFRCATIIDLRISDQGFGDSECELPGHALSSTMGACDTRVGRGLVDGRLAKRV